MPITPHPHAIPAAARPQHSPDPDDPRLLHDISFAELRSWRGWRVYRSIAGNGDSYHYAFVLTNRSSRLVFTIAMLLGNRKSSVWHPYLYINLTISRR